MIAQLRSAVLVALIVGTVSVVHASDDVWEALRAPGSVIVLRHSYAPGGYDPPNAQDGDCSTQRNLDERGRTQARRLGRAPPSGRGGDALVPSVPQRRRR